MGAEVGGEEVVGAPPEEEAGAEDQGGGEAVVKAWETVGAELSRRRDFSGNAE